VLIGPTATGKSAVGLAVAEQIGGEIVGCDSLQVYRGFCVGTAKPTPAERERVPHHLVDFVDPRRGFSLAEFVRLAEAAILEITGRGKVPLIVGGTGMYLRGLLRGIVPAPPGDRALRERLRRIGRSRGSEWLHRYLARLDPESARRLPVADVQRIVRAIDLARSSDRTWSERLQEHGTWGARNDRYPCLKFGLDMDRRQLVRQVEERVEGFFENGLVEEVRGLLRQGVPADANAFKAIGYREVLAAISQGRDPDRTREEVKRSTRRYVKRQRTWLRNEPGLRWLGAAEEPQRIADRIVEAWQAFAASSTGGNPAQS